MELTNCKISTEYKPDEEETDEDAVGGNYVYYIRIEVPIPGGKAIYNIASSKDKNESIEKALKLK